MLNFDAYQRCETVKHLINWAMPEPGRILDIGGYPGRMRSLAPEHEWFICDPRVDAPGDQLIGSASHLPFKDDAFDLALSLDVFEHLPEDIRQQSLSEMSRVSRHGLILTFPYAHPLVEAAERCVSDIYEHQYDRPHPWLAEHTEHPLPNAETIIQWLDTQVGESAVIDVGRIDRWVQLQLLDRLLESLPKSLEVAKSIDRKYEEILFSHDFQKPAYRKIILHLFTAKEPLDLQIAESTPEEETAAEIAFQQYLTSELLNLTKQKQPKPEADQQNKRHTSSTDEEDSHNEYISRLEVGLQHWEKTYTSTLHEINEANAWRNNLEQRTSFKIYKLLMRLLGHRVDC